MGKLGDICLDVIRDEEGDIKYYKILKEYIGTDKEKGSYFVCYVEPEDIYEESIKGVDNITIDVDGAINISGKNALGEAIKALEEKIVSLVVRGERIEIKSLGKSKREEYIIEEKGSVSNNIKEEVEKIGNILNCSYIDAVYICSKYLEDMFLGGIINEFDMYADDWEAMGLNDAYLLYVGNTKDMNYINIVISKKIEDIYTDFEDYAKIFPMKKHNFESIQEDYGIRLCSCLTTLGDVKSSDFEIKKYYENENGIIDKISVKPSDESEEIIIPYIK